MNAYTLTGPRLGGLWLPELGTNFASTPDEAGIKITGDIDVRVRLAFDSVVGDNARTPIAKLQSGAGNRSWRLYVSNNARFGFQWFDAGDVDRNAGGDAERSITSIVSDGEPVWLRATMDVDNGAGGYTIKFFHSADGVTWTQLGDDVVGGSTTAIYDSGSPLEVGKYLASNHPMNGTVYAAEVRSGIGGTIVAAPNFTAPLSYWRNINGDTRWDGYRVWTINGTACEWR